MQQMIRRLSRKRKGQILKQNKKKNNLGNFSGKTDTHFKKIFCVEIALLASLFSSRRNKNFFSELMISNFLQHTRLHLPVYEPQASLGPISFQMQTDCSLPMLNYIHNNSLRKFSQSLLLEHNILLKFRLQAMMPCSPRKNIHSSIFISI